MSFGFKKIRMVLPVAFCVLLPAFDVVAAADDREMVHQVLDTALDTVGKIGEQGLAAKAVLEEKLADILEPQPMNFGGITEKKSPPEQKRNPFAFTKRLHRAAANGEFSPMEKDDELPPMHLRGLIQGDGGELIALLEIEKAIHIVRAGDAVGLNDLGFNTVIRINKINRLHLEVETGTMGQLIIVR